MTACICHDPIVFGHVDAYCPQTAVPEIGYSGSLGCTPDCREQHTTPEAIAESERARRRNLAMAGAQNG